jgi:hypothetical protein
MSGGVAQLISVGLQDAVLTGTPQISFFRSNYKQYTHFASSVERQILMSQPTPGAMTSIQIQNKGDLLSYGYLTATTASNGLVQNINWSTAIDKVELWIGGVIVDTQDSVFNYLIEPVTMSGTYSQRYGGITSNVNSASNTFYPFKFFFCKDYQNSLPLCGMIGSPVELRIYWLPTMPAVGAYQFESWFNYIYLDTPERAHFTNSGVNSSGSPNSIKMLIWQVQRQLIPQDYTMNLTFNNPVKFMAANVLPYTSGNMRLNLNIDGQDVGLNRSLIHFQEVSQYFNMTYGLHNPGSINGNLAPAPVFCYPFCLETNKLQPTGTVNFSRVDTFQLKATNGTGMTLTAVGNTNGIFPMGSYLYAVSYNILTVQSGIASLLYSN